tara:strand:+ start:1260 stop:1973 length:714 start_codon:yes stop_codon:yes gene_type:complete
MLGVFALALDAHAGALVVQTIGEAYDQDTDRLLYREVHCVSADTRVREVAYRNPQAQLIAFKALDYQAGPWTPSFVQRNVHSNSVLAVQLAEGKILLTRTEGDSEPEVATLQPGGEYPVVVDAGFDAFVTDNWDSLVAGKVGRFQFPVAARETLVELSIERARCSYETETDQCFRLELDNWLLRMVAEHIELGYDASTQRLARFRGVSNIGDGSGAGMAVDIQYRYHDLAALQCERS